MVDVLRAGAKAIVTVDERTGDTAMTDTLPLTKKGVRVGAFRPELSLTHCYHQ